MNAPTSPITEFVDLKAQYAVLKESINARISEVLQHGQFIMGPEVNELEARLAAYSGAKHCITCASGTEALLIALMALNIKSGDEVITTPFTFVATAEMIALLGAKPVFVDIDSDTCNIDVSQIESAITPRTRAVLPVSLYGQPADMDEINVIAENHGLCVIEDAAQSFGALYKNRHSCNLSTIGCTSFFPSKPLGCYGDGGALFTSDDVLAAAMREIRVHGQSKRYHHSRIGVGGRMDTLQCAVVLAKLERFEWEIEQRIRLGKRYDTLFAALSPALRTILVKPERTSVYAQYTIISESRDIIQASLRTLGVPTAVHYPVPLHRQPAYCSGIANIQLPVSEALGARVISLPMYPDLRNDIQDRIVAHVEQSIA
jgi:UDP-2-acetamido-2-deoxy-ribo-hexuluronate aminotransferase